MKSYIPNQPAKIQNEFFTHKCMPFYPIQMIEVEYNIVIKAKTKERNTMLSVTLFTESTALKKKNSIQINTSLRATDTQEKFTP